MREKLLTTGLFILGLYLIVSSVKDLYGLAQKGKEVQKIQLKLQQTLEEKTRLEKRLNYVKTPEFVEKEARDKLGMSKPGETIVILPEDVEKIVSVQKEPIKIEIPNWKKWGQVFGIFK